MVAAPEQKYLYRLFEKGRLLEVSNAELNNSNCLFFFEILTMLRGNNFKGSKKSIITFIFLQNYLVSMNFLGFG